MQGALALCSSTIDA